MDRLDCHPLLLTPDSVRLNSILVVSPPQVVGDTLVIGSGRREYNATWQVFAYDIRRASFTFTDIPHGVDPALADLAVSPDGRFVAYLPFDTCGLLGVVARFPALTELARTSCHPVPPTDMPVGDVAWLSDTVALFIQTSDLAAQNHWLRFRATVPGLHFIADTVSPPFHAQSPPN